MRAVLAVILLAGCDRVFDLDRLEATPAPCTPAGEGFVHWGLDEGNGTTAADDSGTTPLALVGGVGWTEDPPRGFALDFDGSNDAALAAAPSPLDDLEAFTFAAWINPRSAGKGELGVIVAKGGSGVDASRRFLVNNASGANALELAVNRDGVVAQVFTAADTVRYGIWQHVAATYSADDGPRIYIDGVEATYREPPQPGDGAVESDARFGHAVGSWPELSSNGVFDGAIDDVRIVCRRLDAAEVAELVDQANATR